MDLNLPLPGFLLDAEQEELAHGIVEEEEAPEQAEEQQHDFDLNLPLDEFGAVDMDFIQNMAENGPALANHRRKEMTDDMRKQVYQTLLARSNNGILHKKDTQIVADQFGLHVRSVRRVWSRGKMQLANLLPVVVGSLKKGRVGRKAIPIDLEVLRTVPLKERMTLEDVCAKLDISKWKLIRFLRQGKLRRHSSSLKPFLTPANKKTRLQFCIDMIKRGLNGEPMFRDFFDFVFIDEKWFYLYQKSENFYLLPDEDDPHRTCKNKNYIPRLMFLTVVARPRFRDGVCTFDGKIGCFPLVTYEPAMRGNAAIGRVRGDMVMKPIQSITRDVIRDFMINQVLPAIRAKWPREDVRNPIYIQQDNAPSHLKVDDPIFGEAAKQDGFDIRIISQPPNSPDFNTLDLGFFRAIQTIQYKKNAKTIQALVPAVQEAFMEFCPHKANRIFVTLQTVLLEAMKKKGCNNYKIPHINKASLERLDMLPITTPCPPDLLEEAEATLAAM